LQSAPDTRIDETTLSINHRCNQPLCDLSNALFPNLTATISSNLKTTCHDGIFLLRRSAVESYLFRFRPIQLRHSSAVAVSDSSPVMTFGDSKGLSFDRAVIYATKDIEKWLKNQLVVLTPITRAKFYVALTRARYSAGIVISDNFRSNTAFPPEWTGATTP
jgi:DNA helicase II / ATP-dependent DNA helicase PcrA